MMWLWAVPVVGVLLIILEVFGKDPPCPDCGAPVERVLQRVASGGRGVWSMYCTGEVQHSWTEIDEY